MFASHKCNGRRRFGAVFVLPEDSMFEIIQDVL